MAKPNFISKKSGRLDIPEGFFKVLTVSSDGKDLAIDIPEWLTEYLNREILERSLACIEDAFYRLRPDLRKQ